MLVHGANALVGVLAASSALRRYLSVCSDIEVLPGHTGGSAIASLVTSA
jgi:hypothetical protein